VKGGFEMNIIFSIQPEASPASPQEIPPSPPPAKKFRKKLQLVMGLIVVISVVLAVTFIFLLPKIGEGATVPLGLNYTPGEKLTYNLTITMSAMGYTQTATGINTMEILSFDGENYTMKLTIQMLTPISSEMSYNMTMDKTGRIINYTGFPSEMQSFTFAGIPGFGSYFQTNQTKVGESFQIPIYMNISGIIIDGTASYKISEIKNMTVSNCGIYQVFKTEINANNIHATGQSSSVTVNMNMNMNGYSYMEYGTCRLIEFNIQESITGTSGGYTMSMTMTMQMRLTEHTRP